MEINDSIIRIETFKKKNRLIQAPLQRLNTIYIVDI